MATKPFLTSKEAAEYLGFSEYTLRRARCGGTISGVNPPRYSKIGRSVRYMRDDLDAWLKAHTVVIGESVSA